MRLYIFEKESVANTVAKCMANPVKNTGYYDTGDGRVTWLRGHVLKQCDPGDYDAKYQKWDAAHLPIIPTQWKLKILPSAANQFKTVEKLIKEATEIVHAGDNDREGQLLVDEVLIFLQNNKPVKRLLINALDQRSIKKALESLKDNKEFYNLQQSALARSQADWLIGMNFSRAYTLAAQKAGYTDTLVVGRVKTPTISLVVRREEEIKGFKKTKYYILKAAFSHKNGAIQAIWNPKDDQMGINSEGLLIDKSIADELVKNLRSATEQALISKYEVDRKEEAHILPYSLSALQIEAGRRYGYSPKLVLDTMQRLYENKLTTYPRSDCRYLPENQFEEAVEIIENLCGLNHEEIKDWAGGANLSEKSRAWDDKKISAHHAIIPTREVCDFNKLSTEGKNLYYLVAQSYIAQFYPLHVYDQTKITVTFSDEIFTATGRTTIIDGWKVLFINTDKDNADVEGEEAPNLPVVAIDDQVDYMAGYITEMFTKPPVRFTESTLLKAMVEIHKYVNNESLKKQLKDVAGIGTEATRDKIIDDIISKGFLLKEKKYLIPSEKAYLSVNLLPDELTYPDTTAEWEMTFNKMVDGSARLADFIDRQTEFVTSFCRKAGTMELAQVHGETCPKCKSGVLKSINGKNGVFWGCTNKECSATFSDKKGKPDLEPPTACPICDEGVLRLHNGTAGKFWGCTKYPECKASFSDYRGKPVLISCPSCNKGYLKKRNSSKGDFWGCSNYPECKATFEDNKNKPKLK